MDHSLIEGPLIGSLVVIAIAGAITIACFVAMFVMLFRPREKDEQHPKYRVLRDDR
jgi:hypothetical protein